VKVILFGASGMVGQSALRECLLDPEVDAVLSIGRSALPKLPAILGLDPKGKLRELVVKDLCDYSGVESELNGFDACFFCLGVTSAGMSEADYRRVTFDITLAAAETLARLNADMTFIYVSGSGTDSSEKGRSMWARVKGETENALLRLPFKAAYMFRPGFIQPLHGITSKTRSYRIFYVVLRPILPLLRSILPRSILTTEQLGQAMLKVARVGYSKPILEAVDISRV
jgi:uncharacterized protein YbjT (DUF2867 family)